MAVGASPIAVATQIHGLTERTGIFERQGIGDGLIFPTDTWVAGGDRQQDLWQGRGKLHLGAVCPPMHFCRRFCIGDALVDHSGTSQGQSCTTIDGDVDF